MKRYSSDADFVMVYTEEAHPVDGYDLKSNPIKIKTHQDLSDRIEAARNMLDVGLPCPLLLDAMNNEMNISFMGSVGRYAMIEDGRIVHLTIPGVLHHHPKEVELWLEKRV